MGFFGKLAFWKHEGDSLPDLPGFGGNESSTDLTAQPIGAAQNDQTGLGEFKMPEAPTPPFEQEQNPDYPNITPPAGTPPPQQNFQQTASTDVASKNLEIISSKLDYLKASLENINQRLANLEAATRGEEQRPRYGPRW